MKYLKIICILGIFFSSCENVVDNDNGSKLPIAVLTCSNDTVKVGNYCILDGTQNNSENGDTLAYNWEADESNPTDNPYISNYTWMKILYIGFMKEGVYKFRLTVSNGKQNSNTEQVEITVLPRDKIFFDDPSLEIQVRYALKIPTAELTNEDLLKLDSLSNSNPTTGRDKVYSLKGIENCQNITYLNMGGQHFVELVPLSALTNLRELYLDQSWMIKNISPLKDLTNLQKLNLQSNIVEDISALKNLIELKYLNLKENPIKDLSPIGNLRKLEELWLGYNNDDGDLTFITELKNLTLLWITVGKVKDVTPLKDLNNLKKINFDWNNISDLSPLSNLKQLEWLYLDKNQVIDITPLESLENLSRLRLWNNHITDILPLINNKGLGEGDNVGLFGNPLNEKSVNEYIPALRERGVNVEW